MSSALAFRLCGISAHAYNNGYARYGDIGLLPEIFERYFTLVVEKHLGTQPHAATVYSFVDTLHTADLYLTVGCSESNNLAWIRFRECYQEYIDRIATFVSPTSGAGQELASELIADLYLPDRSGRSRIASFDGRQSLSTWLRVIISRRAINLRKLKRNNCECIDKISEIADASVVPAIEASIIRNRYSAILEDCCKRCIEILSDRERLILLWHYDDGVRLIEIAKVLEIHPSGITRQLQKIHLKLKNRILSVLSVDYHLEPAAIAECLGELLDNPAHSLLIGVSQAPLSHTLHTLNNKNQHCSRTIES